MDGAPNRKVPFFAQIATMKWNFWICNIIESFERLAFFGVRAVLPLYMYGTDSVLHLSMSEKGLILGIWAFIQCIVPMVSGGYTDSYGYRLSMYTAFIINISGYALMANATGFWTMLAAACLVGTGTAIFKPPVQGSVAKSLDDGNSGLGFGIFYWMVNVGGFFAPMIASYVRGNEAAPTWNNVFYGAAFVMALNFVPTTFLFREPKIDPEEKKKKPVKVFTDTMLVLWRDQPMLRFLLIISGFWFMFMLLWDLLPNFINEWVDTRDVAAFFPHLEQMTTWIPGLHEGWTHNFLKADGSAKPELLINIDAFTILIFVIPLSWFFGRFRMMTSLVIGMGIGLVGFVCAGLSMTGAFVAAMIFVFAIGEIICSPKFSEFIGMSAPPDKKAIYMGYSNIPFAIGWGLGNALSGPLYDHLASLPVLAGKYLVEKLGMAKEAVDAIKQENLLETVARKLGEGTDVLKAKRILWDTYHPWIIWVILGVIGFVSVVGMWISYERSRRTAASGDAPAAPAEEAGA